MSVETSAVDAKVSAPNQASVVFIVDDDPAVRKSLALLLGSVHLSVELFASADEFLDKYRNDKPGCLLLDVRLPGMGGLELQQELIERGIHLPIVIVTGHADVSMAVRAMKAGAVDLIEKPFSDQTLLDCIHRALQRGSEIGEQDSRNRDFAGLIDKLTPREREVMEKVVAGNSNKMIAAQLTVSQKTVEAHRANVMKKMQAQSVADLVRVVTLHRLSADEE